MKQAAKSNFLMPATNDANYDLNRGQTTSSGSTGLKNSYKVNFKDYQLLRVGLKVKDN
jgi:hypothetical protein